MGVQGFCLVPAGLLIIALALLAVPAGAAEHVSPSDIAPAPDPATFRAISLEGTSTPVIDAALANNLHIPVPRSSASRGISPGQSLQDAIDAANPGDTLLLDPGIYYEYNLTITKTVAFRANESAGGDRTNTIIDAQGLGRIFTVSNSSTLLVENITLRNGRQTGNGGTIESVNGSIYLISSAISNSTAIGDGGAIHVTHGEIVVTSSSFNRCSADRGGAIYTKAGSTAIIIVVVQDSSFSRCTAAHGGAIGTHRTLLVVSSSRFSNCIVTFDGGALYSTNGLTVVVSSRFSDCRAYFGAGGAFFIHGGQLLLVSSSFTDCSAALWGGAIESGNFLMIDSSTFTRCSAIDGGAVDFYEKGASISSSVFTDCSASHQGGAIWFRKGDLSLHSSSFSGCSAEESGGAIHAERAGSSLDISTSTFTGCSAGHAGGAIYTEGPAALHFSRVFGCDNGTAFWSNATSNAENTWWGSNIVPSGSVHGPVDYIPWLRLGISVPNSTLLAGTSDAVQANLTWNSDGTDTAAGGIFVPDGILTRFSVNGPGTVSPPTRRLVEGIAGTTFTSLSPGTSDVCATVDGATVCTGFTAEVPPDTRTPDNDDDAFSGFKPSPTGSPPAANPMTVTVNIAGTTAAGKVTVNGTKIAGLVVTGTVQDGPGMNMTIMQGFVYQYFSLVPAGSAMITSANINFTVPQSWLLDQQIVTYDVTLYRRSADRWEPLPTSVLYSRDGMVHFSAQSPGLQSFAIVGKRAPLALFLTETPTVAAGRPVEEKMLSAPIVKEPVVTETTIALPAADVPAEGPGIPAGLVAMSVCGVGLLGGGMLVRRWWLRRQNPALFA